MVTVCLLAAPAQARPLMDLRAACSTSFDDDADNGDWGTAANWSTDAVPGADDDVCIPAGVFSVSVNGPVPAVRSLDAPTTSLRVTGALTVSTGTAQVTGLDVFGTASFGGALTATTVSLRSGGSLGGTGAMTIRSLTWSGGTLAGTGTTIVGDGALQLRGAGTKQLTSRTLDIRGPSEITGAGALELGTAARVEVASTLTLQGDATLGGTAGAIHVAPGGTLAKAGGGTATVALPLDNDGSLDVSGGTLNLTAGSGDAALSSGAYAVAAGTELQWTAGSFALSSPRSTGPGLMHVDGATVSTSGTGALASIAVDSGRLELLDGATLTTAGYRQTDGTTLLDGGTLAAVEAVDIAGGVLTGTGTVQGGLRNAAAVAPTGTLRVLGDYTQTAAGALRVEIAAAGHGKLEVSGQASLAGRLDVTAAFVSAPGASYELLRAGSVTGAWETESVPDGFVKDFGSTGLSVIAKRPPVPTVMPTPTATATPDGDRIRDAEDSTLPPAAPPVVAKTTRAELASGTVLVKLPASDAGFVPLKGAASLPTGTTVDARAGRVTFTAAGSYGTGPSTPTTITAQYAIFQIRQIRARDNRTAVTDLVLTTAPADVRSCVRRSPRKGLVVRKLKATAKGLVRTIAGASVLTTRNASWRIDDRCDGTRVRVSKGRGSAFNRLTGRSRTLHAREAYLARARLFAARKLQLRAAPRP
jgi:hypothetical protein